MVSGRNLPDVSQSWNAYPWLSALPLVEGANPKPFTFEVQPGRMATDRDQPFRAIDFALALGTGSVFGDVLDGISAILFAFIQDMPVGLLAFAMEPDLRPVTEEDLDEVAGTAAMDADRAAAVDGAGSSPLLTR